MNPRIFERLIWGNFLVVLIVVLASCGGGGGSSESVSDSPSQEVFYQYCPSKVLPSTRLAIVVNDGRSSC